MNFEEMLYVSKKCNKSNMSNVTLFDFNSSGHSHYRYDDNNDHDQNSLFASEMVGLRLVAFSPENRLFDNRMNGSFEILYDNPLRNSPFAVIPLRYKGPSINYAAKSIGFLPVSQSRSQKSYFRLWSIKTTSYFGKWSLPPT